MRLSALFVYPIKACGGVPLREAQVVERGLRLDRRYMLIDRAGRFVTQRELPGLCLVRLELQPDGLGLTAPDAQPLELPLALEGGELVTCNVWNDECVALCHEGGSRWFSELTGRDLRLVFMPDSVQRPVNPKRAQPGDIVSFADGYPCLVVSEASLADLNSRLREPVAMDRFRPNLVLSDCEPYAEDAFVSLRIGQVSFRAVKRCERCVVTTIDQHTAERGAEPLRTLAGYRRQDGKLWFGMNLIHDGPGTLRVGDEAHATRQKQ